MGANWTFGRITDEEHLYADDTSVPSRRWTVFLEGRPVGEIEVHLHRRRGPDKTTDLSVGTTVVTYGPLAERDRDDRW